MQTKVRQLLKEKGGQVWTIAPDASVYDALLLMADKGIGALVVLEGEQIVGLLSERDYARKLILQGRSSRDTPVGDVMTARVLVVRPDQTVEDCMALATDKRIRHFPVMDGDQLVGMVSIGDLVKSVIADQEFMIKQLEHYITG